MEAAIANTDIYAEAKAVCYLAAHDLASSSKMSSVSLYRPS